MNPADDDVRKAFEEAIKEQLKEWTHVEEDSFIIGAHWALKWALKQRVAGPSLGEKLFEDMIAVFGEHWAHKEVQEYMREQLNYRLRNLTFAPDDKRFSMQEIEKAMPRAQEIFNEVWHHDNESLLSWFRDELRKRLEQK